MSHKMPLPPLEFTVQSGLFAAREALATLMAKLEVLNLCVEEAGTVELVMAELLNNIVEHAYPDPDNAGQITIYCRHDETGLRFNLVDSGVPMPGGQAPLGLAVDTNVELMDLPEGGFGWFIIKDLARDIVYRRENDLNHMYLRIPVATAACN